MHRTVLLHEAIEGLNLKDTSIVVDATFGGGGHSLEICKRYPGVTIIAFDQDKNVFSAKGGPASGWEGFVKDRFKGCDITFVNENFRHLGNLKNFGAFALGDIGQGTHDAENLSNLPNGIDAIIFDLGLSSDQLENSGRGFS